MCAFKRHVKEVSSSVCLRTQRSWTELGGNYTDILVKFLIPLEETNICDKKKYFSLIKHSRLYVSVMEHFKSLNSVHFKVFSFRETSDRQPHLSASWQNIARSNAIHLFPFQVFVASPAVPVFVVGFIKLLQINAKIKILILLFLDLPRR